METIQVTAKELRAGDVVQPDGETDGGTIARVDVCDCGCLHVWVLYVDDVGTAPDSEAFEHCEVVTIQRPDNA